MLVLFGMDDQWVDPREKGASTTRRFSERALVLEKVLFPINVLSILLGDFILRVNSSKRSPGDDVFSIGVFKNDIAFLIKIIKFI